MRDPRLAGLVGAIAVVVLAATSTIAVAAAYGAFGHVSSASCAAPSLAGGVVDVTLVDMGNMMGDNSMMNGSASGVAQTHMRLLATPSSVTAGLISFRVHNIGSRTHEVVVLPLAVDHAAGARPVASDGRVDETGSLGEASRNCGAGAGEGIESGSAGWATMSLRAGTYELVCNLKHHYSSGMYATLNVH